MTVLIVVIAFVSAIAWLCYEAFSAPKPDRWAKFQDRINTQPESYQEAVAMAITEDELTGIYEGKP